MSLLPFDLADAFTAVAFQVFGDFNEAEDVLLFEGISIFPIDFWIGKIIQGRDKG